MRWLWLVVLMSWMTWAAALEEPRRDRVPRDIYVLLDDSSSIVGRSKQFTRGHRALADMVRELLEYRGDTTENGSLIEKRDRVQIYTLQELETISGLGEEVVDCEGIPGGWESQLKCYRKRDRGEKITDYRPAIAKIEQLLEQSHHEKRAKVVLIASDFIHDGNDDPCSQSGDEPLRRQLQMAERVEQLRGKYLKYQDIDVTLPLPVGLIYIHTDRPYLSADEFSAEKKREIETRNNCFQHLIERRTLLDAFQSTFGLEAIEFEEASKDIPNFAKELAALLERALDIPLEFHAPAVTTGDKGGFTRLNRASSVTLRNTLDGRRLVRLRAGLINPSLAKNRLNKVQIEVGELRLEPLDTTGCGRALDPLLEGGEARCVELALSPDQWLMVLEAGGFRLLLDDESHQERIHGEQVSLPPPRISIIEPTMLSEYEGVRVRLSVALDAPWPAPITAISLVGEGGCRAELTPVEGAFPLFPEEFRQPFTVEALEPSECADDALWSRLELRVAGNKKSVRAALGRAPQEAPRASLRLLPKRGEFYPLEITVENHGTLREQLLEARFPQLDASPAKAPPPGGVWIAPGSRSVREWLFDAEQVSRLFGRDGVEAELIYRYAGTRRVTKKAPTSVSKWELNIARPPWRIDASGVRLAVELTNHGDYPAAPPTLLVSGLAGKAPHDQLTPAPVGERLLPQQRKLFELPVSPSQLRTAPFRAPFTIGPGEFCSDNCRVAPPTRQPLEIVGPMRLIERGEQLLLETEIQVNDPFGDQLRSIEIRGETGWMRLTPTDRVEDESERVLLHGERSGRITFKLPEKLYDQPIWGQGPLQVRLAGESEGSSVSGMVRPPEFGRWEAKNASRVLDGRVDLNAADRTVLITLGNHNNVALKVSRVLLVDDQGATLHAHQFDTPLIVGRGALSAPVTLEIPDAQAWDRVWRLGVARIELIDGAGRPYPLPATASTRIATKDQLRLSLNEATFVSATPDAVKLRLGLTIGTGEEGAKVVFQGRIGEYAFTKEPNSAYPKGDSNQSLEIDLPITSDTPLSQFAATPIELFIPRLTVSTKATFNELMSFPPPFLSSISALTLAFGLVLGHLLVWVYCRDGGQVPAWLENTPLISPGALLSALPAIGLLIHAAAPSEVPPEWLHRLLIIFAVAVAIGTWRLAFFAADAFLFPLLARHGHGAVETVAASHVGIILAGSFLVGAASGLGTYIGLDANPTLGELLERLN